MIDGQSNLSDAMDGYQDDDNTNDDEHYQQKPWDEMILISYQREHPICTRKGYDLCNTIRYIIIWFIVSLL